MLRKAKADYYEKKIIGKNSKAMFQSFRDLNLAKNKKTILPRTIFHALKP